MSMPHDPLQNKTINSVFFQIREHALNFIENAIRIWPNVTIQKIYNIHSVKKKQKKKKKNVAVNGTNSNGNVLFFFFFFVFCQT